MPILTTTPGYKNPNRQLVIAPTGQPSKTFPGQKIYELQCKDCGHTYGSNGCDIHARLCPACQGGAKGEPLVQPQPTLFN